MTCASEFPGYKKCEKIDACEVSAYTNIMLDPSNPTGIILDTSWDTIKLDLKSIVKAGETITHLELAPEGDPSVLRYMREDGEYDCITGDELSRIISMQLLKDVDQEAPPTNGIVYQYNAETSKFEPYDLRSFVNETNTAIGRINAALVNLQNQINALGDRITDIESIIPFWPSDKTTKLARGDINLISDPSDTNNKAHGLFTHDKDVDVYGDEYFS